MIPVLLTKIKTRDNVLLDGIAVIPRRRTDTALIWIHGLGSSFARGQTLIKELAGQCSRAGIAYFKFNTRGHDIVNRNALKGTGLYGAGFEKFEQSVTDIRAIITYARRLEYRKIILAGHSTGANKALYYLYKTKDPAVKALALLGPVNDIAAGRKRFGAAGLMRGVALAEKLYRKNPQELMPLSYGVISAARFLSMFRQGDAEDIFPYLNPHAGWKELKSIRTPLAVIFGERDEYLLGRRAQNLVGIFRVHAPLAKSFSGVIIKNADHGFKKKERALADAIIRWIKSYRG